MTGTRINLTTARLKATVRRIELPRAKILNNLRSVCSTPQLLPTFERTSHRRSVLTLNPDRLNNHKRFLIAAHPLGVFATPLRSSLGCHEGDYPEASKCVKSGSRSEKGLIHQVHMDSRTMSESHWQLR